MKGGRRVGCQVWQEKRRPLWSRKADEEGWVGKGLNFYCVWRGEKKARLPNWWHFKNYLSKIRKVDYFFFLFQGLFAQREVVLFPKVER